MKEKRNKVKELLKQCTEAQQQFFIRLYADGIDEMSAKTLSIATLQCERTIAKNIANKDNEPLVKQLTHELSPLIAEDKFECVSCKETDKILQSPINTSYCNYCWTKLLIS